MHPTDDDPSSNKVATETVSHASETRPVSRGWLMLGGVAILVGAVMGFIMSSLGK